MANRKKSITSKEYNRNKKENVKILTDLLSNVLDRNKLVKVSERLLMKFGSFSGIINARYEDIAIIGEDYRKIADYLVSFKKAAMFYYEDDNSKMLRVFNTESYYKLMKPLFHGLRVEAVAVMLLDGKSNVLYNDIVNEGSVSEVPIYVRRIVGLCLSYNAYDLIIAHNHPSGNPLPSKNDINATYDLDFSLTGIEVNMIDHLIITDEDYLSMKSSEWMEKIKRDVAKYQEEMRNKAREEEAAFTISLIKQGELKMKCADTKVCRGNMDENKKFF